MLYQSAPAGVMIFSRGCRAPETIPPFVKKRFAQCAQPWISNLSDSFPYKLEIGRLFGAQICRPLQQLIFFLFGQWSDCPLASIQPVLRLAKFRRELDEIVHR
jgi:hypothetical protein